VTCIGPPNHTDSYQKHWELLFIAPSPHLWADCNNLYVINVFPRQQVPFGGFVYAAPHI